MFTLSLLWCTNGIVYQQVISTLVSYLFTKFHTSKHLSKRVTQTCMFTLFFVVVRKGYCLPTSYQNVGVVLLIPTCKDPLLIGDKTHAQIALTPIRDKILICQTFRSILRPLGVTFSIFYLFLYILFLFSTL